MDDIYDDDDSLYDSEFDEPTGSNDDLFIPVNQTPNIKDWMVIGSLSEEEAWKEWERKWSEENYIPF
jgi:hypothetical protein